MNYCLSANQIKLILAIFKRVVGLRAYGQSRSTDEATEQRGLALGGGCGGKDFAQEEHRSGNRSPDSEPGHCVEWIEWCAPSGATKKEVQFTALLHHLTIELLEQSYFALKRNSAPGLDGVTWYSCICPPFLLILTKLWTPFFSSYLIGLRYLQIGVAAFTGKVAALKWNGWQHSSGIGGSFRLEYAVDELKLDYGVGSVSS